MQRYVTLETDARNLTDWKLMVEAVEWLTADQPDWWHKMAWQEQYDFVSDLMGYNPKPENEVKASEFVQTELSSGRYFNWYEGLVEVYDCMRIGCRIGLHAMSYQEKP